MFSSPITINGYNAVLQRQLNASLNSNKDPDLSHTNLYKQLI